MAFDGSTVNCIKRELTKELTGARLNKIAQPEPDELLLTFKTAGGLRRLLISANASLPLIYLTDKNKPGPATAPNFCMLLRKHIQNGRLINISQPSLERILIFEIEHMDEMGDLKRKKMIVELMGKHSNIIFTDEDGIIIDSIKHVNSAVSSVREVLPGRDYFIPNTLNKLDPFAVTEDELYTALREKAMPTGRAIYSVLTGFSPVISEELCYRAGADPAIPPSELSGKDLKALYTCFDSFMSDLSGGSFSPNIVYDKRGPVEFAVFDLSHYKELDTESYDSISELIEDYYEKKSRMERIRQKSSDLRHIVRTALERNIRKYDIQLKQLKDTEKMDRFRVYGELINAYGYGLDEGAKSFEADDYHTGEKITIPLDENLSPTENAKKYFEKYNKLKRTREALTVKAKETSDEIDHLESIENSLNIATEEDDLVQIKEELADCGYIRRHNNGKKLRITSRPFHYLSSDGFHIYVGKNNYQNDELTFKFAGGGDWWFHAKGMPGSHVIVKSEGKELPDRVFEEAGALAAYYSKGRDQNKLEIDYVKRREIKKPGGSAPGFVVYYTNYSLVATPDISALEEIIDRPV